MPDESGRYSDSERRAYPTPTCRVCGARAVQEWADAASLADTEPWWKPGRVRCPDASRHPAPE